MMKRWIILTSLFFSAAGLSAELSPYAANKALQANQLAQETRFVEAIELLQTTKLNREYDKAYIARMLGVFYWQNEQLNEAITALQLAVDSHQLVADQAWSTRRMLADLLLMDQQYQAALTHYYQLIHPTEADELEAETYQQLWLRIGQIHYQLQQWTETLAAITRYESYRKQDEVTPLSLKLGSQLQLEQWQPAIVSLKRLITLQSDRSSWWLQLVSLELRTGQAKQALNSLGLAKLHGVELTGQELRLLAQLYAQHGIPERAAQILASLIEDKTHKVDVELLTETASYWQRAREWDKAIATWSLAADQDVKYYWNVAQLYSLQGNHALVLATLDKVKEKERQHEVALTRARALYKLNRLDDALFEAKRAHHLQPSDQSQSWVKFLSQLRTINQPIQA